MKTERLLDTPALRLFSFQLQPGEEVKPHTSTSPLVVIVRAGRGSVLCGERWSELTGGDWLHVPAGASHGFRATGESFELLAVVATAAGSELTVDEAQRRFPGATALLNGLGIDTCCGGGEGLAEAARRVGRNPADVLAALAAAGGGNA